MGKRSLTSTAQFVFALALSVLLAGMAAAEWVKGDVRLNLRTGPGLNRKIITTIATGDRVTVLSEEGEWTHVRISDGRDGWIPAGFLAAQVPAVVRLERAETEVSNLRDRLDKTSTESGKLKTNNESLSQHNEALTSLNRRLDEENRDLKAGARWPEWIAGASILVMGMLVGAVLQSWTARRTSGRIRL